jgi:arylsulfatase A-like enzyme
MSAQKPNVVLVITDDQGYGDLGCTGNSWIQTPHIDAFHDDAVRLTDFHVSPLCTPTRGAIMTGKNPVRNGAWATCWGRSILKKDQLTMADVFATNGYRTGMFGKWHLGDNYPYRPQDRGFQHVVAHKGGGVGQTPDFWGNNYFDDTYFHNGKPVSHEGYCTDVWFEEATRFIEEDTETPFFTFISTNAPHSPYLVADRYKEPYLVNPDIPEPAFNGMITNIDENFGRLRARLAELGLEENTILIFMTDNGSSGGSELDENGFVTTGYNAGMRGKKGSYYDGGHRVPFFMRWPAASLKGGRDVTDISHHVDLLPTFIDLCGLGIVEESPFDGTSVAKLIQGDEQQLPDDRVQFVQYRQNTNPPEKWDNAVLTRQWRLIGGTELYDIKADPGQRHDVAAKNAEVVERLRSAHEEWWEEIQPSLLSYAPIALGHEAENPTKLCAMDVMGDVAWHQTHIIQAQTSTGNWMVEVTRPGSYRFTLRRWPRELDLAIDGAVEADDAKQHIYASDAGICNRILPAYATLSLFHKEERLDIEPGVKEVTFVRHVARTGVGPLEAWFLDGENNRQGACYVYVERVGD